MVLVGFGVLFWGAVGSFDEEEKKSTTTTTTKKKKKQKEKKKPKRKGTECHSLS